jgi:hypothetical protein
MRVAVERKRYLRPQAVTRRLDPRRAGPPAA